MQQPTTGQVIASDGTLLHYEERGVGRPLVLLHGWGFSSRFFTQNAEALALHARVISVDLRGHGESGKPHHGYRVARLAKDLRDLLSALDLREVTVLGWSLGAPIIWSYLELFGRERLSQAVFVQQVPRQYRSDDWAHAHTSIFDEASLARTLARVEFDDGFDGEQLDTIFHVEPGRADRSIFLKEMAKAPAHARNAVMTDHARHDWRDVLPTFALPCLVMVGCKDPVYPWQGPAWVGDAIPHAQTVLFEHSSHALFHDEPGKFNRTVAEFMASVDAPPPRYV